MVGGEKKFQLGIGLRRKQSQRQNLRVRDFLSLVISRLNARRVLRSRIYAGSQRSDHAPKSKNGMGEGVNARLVVRCESVFKPLRGGDERSKQRKNETAEAHNASLILTC